MLGRATLTMVVSSRDMKAPSMTVASARRAARPGLAVPVVAGAMATDIGISIKERNSSVPS